MPNDEIVSLKDKIVEQLSPLKVYLFGSYAYGIPTDDSDYDFYILLDDSRTNWHEETVKAYRAIGRDRTHPVDILVGTESKFEKRKHLPTIEQEVFQKGVLLYG